MYTTKQKTSNSVLSYIRSKLEVLYLLNKVPQDLLDL